MCMIYMYTYIYVSWANHLPADGATAAATLKDMGRSAATVAAILLLQLYQHIGILMQRSKHDVPPAGQRRDDGGDLERRRAAAGRWRQALDMKQAFHLHVQQDEQAPAG